MVHSCPRWATVTWWSKIGIWCPMVQGKKMLYCGKQPAHSCVVGCKERGMIIMHLFVVHDMGNTTHGAQFWPISRHF